MKTAKAKWYSKLGMVLFFLLYYAPLVSLMFFSFNSEKSVNYFGSFSLKWYGNLFSNWEIILVVARTFFIAVLATTISIIIGTLAAIGLSKTRRKYRALLLQANNLPITNPDIVTAIGLLLLFVAFGVEKGFGTLLLAHISFCTPYVIITVYPKVKGLDPNIVEAAMDLGAKPLKAITSAVIPQIKGSILAAFAISFTMSFDDFVISYFTGGDYQNISTYLYSGLRKGVDPTFNALSTVIILIIVIKIVVSRIKESKKEEIEE